MILQARKDIGKPSVRVDVIESGTLDQRVDRGSPVAALVGAREGPIVAAHGNGANLPLGRIVGHAQPTIIEEACECRPSGEAVGNGLTNLALSGELGALLVQPSLQRDQEGATALVAHVQAFLRRLTVDLALDGEQDVDALDRFDGNRRLVEPGEVEELASCMRPACWPR